MFLKSISFNHGNTTGWQEFTHIRNQQVVEISEDSHHGALVKFVMTDDQVLDVP